jgi:putative SOS response-associated peptidase YedK
MCGRFSLTASIAEIKKFYHAEADMEWPPSDNVAPSQYVPVLTADANGLRAIRPMKWGLVPFWAKDAKIGNRMINARAETVDTGNAFRAAFRARRCIVPADGFYEWDRGKRPYLFAPEEGLLSLAGVWERWKKPGAPPLESFTIITTDADDTVRPVHERMPVLIGHNAIGAWLAPDTEPALLKSLLEPASGRPLHAHPADRRMNNPRYHAADREPA